VPVQPYPTTGNVRRKLYKGSVVTLLAGIASSYLKHGATAMKCVKNTRTNEIIRVSDNTAMYMVQQPSPWEYCPKWEWKAQREASK
jgi:hypothetical protein